MSSQTLPDDYPLLAAAEEIDWDFNDLADKLPIEAKMAPSGIAKVLFEQEGVGRLQSTYLGGFMIRLTIITDGPDKRLGYCKDYSLGYYDEVVDGKPLKVWAGGKLQEVASTTPDDLVDCPFPIAQLMQTIRAVREGYIRQEYHDEEADSASLAFMPLRHA